MGSNFRFVDQARTIGKLRRSSSRRTRPDLVCRRRPSAQYAARALTERRGFATIAPRGPRRLHPMDHLPGGEGRPERGQALGC